MLKDLEIKRKLFHMCSGILIVILADLDIINPLILTIILVLGIITSLLSVKFKFPIIYWFLENMDRNFDIKKYPGKGAITFLIGIILTLILFEKNIALASILILTIGDAVSPIVGMHFGKIKNPLNNKKLIEGTIVGILAASILASIFISYKEAIIASVIGMIVETIELKIHKGYAVDDNITVPLAAGLTIYVLRLF